MIDAAIFLASKTIAESETPSRLPEPAELASMRQELSQLETMKSPRAKAAADSLRDDILKLQASLYLDEEQRQQAVITEWGKVINQDDRTDADRKRIATNYGLTIKVEHGKMVGFDFKRLGIPVMTRVALVASLTCSTSYTVTLSKGRKMPKRQSVDRAHQPESIAAIKKSR